MQTNFAGPLALTIMLHLSMGCTGDGGSDPSPSQGITTTPTASLTPSTTETANASEPTATPNPTNTATQNPTPGDDTATATPVESTASTETATPKTPTPTPSLGEISPTSVENSPSPDGTPAEGTQTPEVGTPSAVERTPSIGQGTPTLGETPTLPSTTPAVTPTEIVATPTAVPDTPTMATPTVAEPTATQIPTPTLPPTPRPYPPADGRFALELNPGIEAYGEGFQGPQVSSKDGLVLLSGRIQLLEGQWQSGQEITQIPEAYCPNDTLIFALNQGDVISEVAIRPDCSLIYQGGAPYIPWISLSDIVYSLKGSDDAGYHALEETYYYKYYGNGYATPHLAEHGDILVLDGLFHALFDTWTLEAISHIPEGFCPQKQMGFEVKHPIYTAQLDLLSDCRLFWSSGVNSGDTMSISQIQYIHPESTARESLSLADGMTPGSSTYQSPSYLVQNQRIFLEGQIKNSQSWDENTLLAVLPEGLRPAESLTFNTANGGSPTQIDIHPNGEIRFVTGNIFSPFARLTGIAFDLPEDDLEPTPTPTLDPTPTEPPPQAPDYYAPLALNPQKVASRGAEYGTPLILVEDNAVLLSGSVKSLSGTWTRGDVIATLPAGYCPDEILIFDTTQGPQLGAQLDIMPTCEIIFQYGHLDVDWVSLNGAFFSLHRLQNGSPAEPLTLNARFSNYENGYARAQVSIHDDVVILEGEIIMNSGNWSDGYIGLLPSEYCPDTRRAMHAKQAISSVRVDILPDCQVLWTAGSEAGNYLSLANLTFTLGESDSRQALTLGPNISIYGHTYPAPSFYLSGNRVHLAGLASVTGGWTHNSLVATLPENHRPKDRLIFTSNRNGETTQVDILPNGEIRVMNPGGSDWISLDGIVFPINMPFL